MMSPERFNPEDQDSLWKLREKVDREVGKPSPLEAKMLVWQYKPILQKVIFDPLFSDKNRLKKYLTRLNEPYKDNPYSPLLVCVSLVDYIKQSILTQAESVLPETQDDGQLRQLRFAVLLDTFYGMGLQTESAIIAQKHLQKPLENPLSDVVDTVTEHYNLPLGENAEVFLSARQLSSYFAQLLEKDPSGESLMRNVIRFLKDPKYAKRVAGIDDMVLPYTIRRFVVAGAEIGEELRKKLYPLTKNLSSQ